MVERFIENDINYNSMTKRITLECFYFWMYSGSHLYFHPLKLKTFSLIISFHFVSSYSHMLF